MSSSCDAAPGYVRLEYTEDNARGSVQPEEEAPARSRSDAEALFQQRLEAEKSALAVQLRAEQAREVQRARATVGDAVRQFEHEREEYFHRVEAEVVQLALAVARRIIHRETQVDPKLLAAAVRYELERIDAATEVRLQVAPALLAYWKEAVSALPNAVTVEPEPRLEADEVRLQTALGSCAVNFENEMKEIERGFFDLLAARNKPASGAATVQ
ncbi:MAG: FliH/SctL family protein [Acidobacteriota bacterium]|nr:FliH/SctL family protein [Acidobacteriota bacterium]